MVSVFFVDKILFVTGVFDASGGLFLLIKLLYDAGVSLQMLIYGYSSLFIITWIKCVFLTPSKFVEGSKMSSFQLSTVGSCLYKSEGNEKLETSDTSKTLDEFKTCLRESVCSVPYSMFVVFISIITTRCSSIPAWIHPWLEWTFYDRHVFTE